MRLVKCFDAQRFELFLYKSLEAELVILGLGFDAQRFELFLYPNLVMQKKDDHFCFDAQCSELFLYLSSWSISKKESCVSMLNVLSFFFILKNLTMKKLLSLWFRCSTFWAFSLYESGELVQRVQEPSFDAQRSELFLYIGLLVSNLNRLRFVSMLNVLSFFFIDTEWGQRLVNDLFRCSMFWAFSLLSKEVWEQSSLLTLRFDAQCFELFLYIKRWRIKNLHLDGFDAQCFELFLYEIKLRHPNYSSHLVSMLNVLSFFFIRT